MSEKLTFINTTAGFLTPTSGAIASWILEMSEAASETGTKVSVLSRLGDHEPYDVPSLDLHFLRYPEESHSRVLRNAQAHVPKRKSWDHPREVTWAKEVVVKLKEMDSDRSIIMLHNDVALAAYLAKTLPLASVAHLFHNQLPWHSRVRRTYAGQEVLSFAVSSYTARWIEREFGLSEGVVNVLYNGVDVKRFAPSSERSGRSEQSNRLPVIVYSGLINENKGVDTLLSAAIKLVDTTDRFSVQLLGNIGSIHGSDVDDDFSRRILNLVDVLADKGVQVERPGYVPWLEMPDLLRRSSIHAVPSRWEEPFPLSALEGMASGLAIVASRQGGLPEAVANAGLLFDAGDEQALADHLRALVLDEGLRIEYGLKARARAEQFTWAQTWDRLRRALSDRFQREL